MYRRPKLCPNCGNPVRSTWYDGYCSDTCVEIVVDENIMRKHDMRQWEEDRYDRERERGY